jgi:hypothetical protein
MIFFCLNWWPHPIRWFSSLGSTDKFTFAVAIFTAVMSIATCVQVWAFIQSERAFVFMLSPQFDGDFGPNKALILRSAIKNGGRSTGFITDFNINLKFIALKDSLPPEPSYKKGGGAAPAAVPPGEAGIVSEDFEGPNGAPHLVLTPADAESITSRAIKLYIVGFITYTDDFSVFGDRITGFCYQFDGASPNNLKTCTERAYTYAR